MMTRIAIILLFYFSLLLSAPLRANTPPWDAESDAAFSYYARNQPITQTLRDFARSVRTPITIHGELTGTVSGTHTAATPTQFLSNLAQDYQFVWYYDGSRLLIYTPDMMQTRTFQTQYESAENLRQRILNSRHWDSRFLIDIASDGKSVIAKGPPRMLELISLTATNPYQPHEITTRVFELKHAWASDKTFSYRDKTISIPGVATILGRLLSSGQAPTSSTSSAAASIGGPNFRSPLQGLRGLFTNTEEDNVTQNTNQQQQPASFSNIPLIGRIEADPRLNAVVVHDLEAHMQLYQDVIHHLDKPTGLVEIKAAIIDISTENRLDVGIAWRGRNNANVAAGYGTITNTFSPGTIFAAIGENADPIALSASGARYFLSQVRLMQREGKAQIRAEPSVITVDNFEALLDLNQTFHVRVQGREAVDLFPITTGTLLRVTPHIVIKDNKKAIHMAIAIEDGTTQEGTVDDIPIITNNAINTQALVGENESLLIGGYYLERNEDSETRIPILGDIPFLGRLFSTRNRSKVYNERLYMITPRIVATPF